MGKRVFIDCVTEKALNCGKATAAIVVDVIRSATVASTVLQCGHRCFYAPTVEAALLLAKQLDRPLLVGEVGGNMPYGFDLRNSPIEIEKQSDRARPVILVSSSGIPLLYSLSRNCNSVYLACLRNYRATISHIAGLYDSVNVLGAPTRGEFREEDKLCCSWIAVGLMKAGYNVGDKKTEQLISDWKDKPVTVCSEGKSAKYLRETGQENDLDFILHHVNDLKFPLIIRGNEILTVS